jgi:hypothetical protein
LTHACTLDDYCPKPIYEDKYSKYIGASVIASDVYGIQEVGPYQKVLKEYCSICGGSVDFKAIWDPPANTQDEDFNGSAKSMPELTAQQHQ